MSDITNDTVLVPGSSTARSLGARCGEVANVRDYGAVGNGVADDTAGFIAAAATGLPVVMPYGDFRIWSPVTFPAALHGDGCDFAQTSITLLGDGELVVGDEYADWGGFTVKSAVNNKIFIKCAHSFFSFKNFILRPGGTPQGQTGIRFDTTNNSVYSSNIENFVITLSYPIWITGNGVNVFNANKIGGSMRDHYENFASAITIEGTKACDANHWTGYFENGVNVFNFQAAAFRENRIESWRDNVTRLMTTGVDMPDTNFWRCKAEQFIFGGVGKLTNQVFTTNKARFRAYKSGVDQTIPDATFAKVSLNAESYDDNSDFDSDTHFRYTARYTQRLLVMAQVDVSGSLTPGDRIRLSIYKNGAAYTTASEYVCSTGGARIRVSDALGLIAGDTVELFVWAAQNSGTPASHTVAASVETTYMTGVEL